MQRQTNLSTREARAKLKARKEPYWRELARGKHIGFAKGEAATTWRYRAFADGRYIHRTLGRSDDYEAADGVTVLTWEQALQKALDKSPQSIDLTRHSWRVWQAAEEYFKARGLAKYGTATDAGKLGWNIATPKEHEGKKDDKESLKFVERFGQKQVAHLRAHELATWFDELKDARGSREEQRKREATANRILNIVKAMLNHSVKVKRVTDDAAWRDLKRVENVDEPRQRFLSSDECRRLLQSCDPDFRCIAHASLLTGCRYGELCALRVSDVVDRSVRISASGSKGGKSRTVPLNDEGVKMFAKWCAGKKGSDHVFTRDNGEPWSNQHQKRRIGNACKVANIDPPCVFHDLRRSYGSLLVNSGTPLHVISKLLGHASILMTQRVYAVLEQKTLRAELRSLPKFGGAPAPATKAKRPAARKK